MTHILIIILMYVVSKCIVFKKKLNIEKIIRGRKMIFSARAKATFRTNLDEIAGAAIILAQNRHSE